MIQFGLSTINVLTNGLETGCAITDGGGGTAVMASGNVYIGGKLCVFSAVDLDLSAAGHASGTKYFFGRIAAGSTATATLDATSVDPRYNDGAVVSVANFNDAGFVVDTIDPSGCTATKELGRAMNCSVNITYDQAVARGGTLVFGNDMKNYNGSIEGTLEHADFTGADWAYMYGGVWASGGGAGCGTWTLTATNQPFPFAIKAQVITNGITNTITLHKCYSPGLTINMDRENFIQPSVNFQAVADEQGEVITIAST